MSRSVSELISFLTRDLLQSAPRLTMTGARTLDFLFTLPDLSCDASEIRSAVVRSGMIARSRTTNLGLARLLSVSRRH